MKVPITTQNTKLDSTKAYSAHKTEAVESGSDLEVVTPSRRRLRPTHSHKGPSRSISKLIERNEKACQSSSEESVLVSSAKRRRIDRAVPNWHHGDGDDEPSVEIAADLEDLQETGKLATDIRLNDAMLTGFKELQDHRTRSRPTESKHSKAMAILRQRRANKAASSPVTTHNSLNSSADASEISDGCHANENAGSGKLNDVRQTLREDLDVSDNEFVTSDDEAPSGDQSALYDMPLEYTRHSHKPLKDHFRDAVEWLVHNKLNAAFSRNDPLYRIAFNRLDDEVKGYSGSKFISSAWAGDFARSLKARPELSYRPTREALFEHKCDACNRSGHPATWQLSFPGKVYDRETLEDIADESEEDSRDVKGNYVPPAEKQYFVGR